MRKDVTIALIAGLAAAGADAPPGATPAPPPQTIRVHVTARDAQLRRYHEVPFEVPPGTTRLDVAYRYDRAGGASVIDLGLWEPGPLALGAALSRGWSGGERQAVFVAVDGATPGYWPGPIPAGRWHVGLGLYRVADGGVDVEVTVTTSQGGAGSTPAVPRSTGEPLRRGSAWYAGALHTHTTHSDGRLAPAELAAQARAAGLDFLAVTDHNNTAHQVERVAVEGLLTIVGEEVTTPGGHASVWGLRGGRAFVDFRVRPGEAGVETLVEAAHGQGALFAINHPFAECYGCGWTHAVPAGADALEVLNGGSTGAAEAIALWDTLLRQGRRLTAVGTSDWHRAGERPIDAACVRVRADELSVPAILRGIREGRVVVMADAATAPPLVTVRAGGREAGIGDTLALPEDGELQVEVRTEGAAYAGGRARLLWRGEVVDSAPTGPGQVLHFRRWVAGDGYLRVQVSGGGGSLLAMTNPTFVRRTSAPAP
jgi:predicted metal-dependent phosphoesterase TrpH